MVADRIKEVIFVGLPGPTHHYGGLSADNVAAMANQGSLSNPKQAALQVLELVRLLMGLGVPVAILPPQLRPHMPLLRQHYTGDDDSVIAQAGKKALALLEKASSASAMWVANAATVAPGIDCEDGRLHITAANLFVNLHRRIEAEDTYRVLASVFAAAPDCVVHPPLPTATGLHDEGAANHMRLSPDHSATGLHVFVYGTGGSYRDPAGARQSLSASHALRAQHRIQGRQSLFLKQNPDIIAQGVFHNDVIAVSNERLLLVHERAYEGGRGDIDRIAESYRALHPGSEPVIITIDDNELTVEEAVQTYFFNSQIVTKKDGGMAIVAPAEVQSLYDGKAAALMQRLCRRKDNPIDEVRIVDLRQSMRNGGGPACLRLRVPMAEAQLSAVAGQVRVLADEVLLKALAQLIDTHYPAELSPQGLADPALYHGCRNLLAELGNVMRLPLLPG